MRYEEKLFEENKGLAYSVANKFRGVNGFEFADLVQIALMGLWEGVQHYKKVVKNLGGFLYSAIAQYVSRVVNKSSVRNQIPTLSLDFEYNEGDESYTLMEVTPNGEPKLGQDLIESELEREIISLLDERGYNGYLWLRVFQGKLSLKDLSEMINTPLGSIHSQKVKVKQILREELWYYE